MDERACVMEALRLAGSIILENGGETYRVEDTVERLGRALGAEDVQPFAVPSGVFITANFPDGSMSTKVYRARSSGKHLKKVDEVNRISRLAAEGRIGTQETLEALRAVKNEGSAYRLPLRVFANAASAGGFTAMFGGGWIEAIAMPGHTRDSIAFRLSDDSALFTGDTLFVDCIGFCRSKDMFDTITKKLLPLPDGLVVYSGHDYGSVPFRTLGEEKKFNPYLNCPTLEAFRQQLRHLE